jgi:hypothetical protein
MVIAYPDKEYLYRPGKRAVSLNAWTTMQGMQIMKNQGIITSPRETNKALIEEIYEMTALVSFELLQQNT